MPEPYLPPDKLTASDALNCVYCRRWRIRLKEGGSLAGQCEFYKQASALPMDPGGPIHCPVWALVDGNPTCLKRLFIGGKSLKPKPLPQPKDQPPLFDD
jgi:hypothetical protein